MQQSEVKQPRAHLESPHSSYRAQTASAPAALQAVLLDTTFMLFSWDSFLCVTYHNCCLWVFAGQFPHCHLLIWLSESEVIWIKSTCQYYLEKEHMFKSSCHHAFMSPQSSSTNSDTHVLHTLHPSHILGSAVTAMLPESLLQNS